MDHNLQEYFDTALHIAEKAGEKVKDAFYKEKLMNTKESFADIVTETDQAVERFIIDSLSQKYPSHRFIGEESTADGQKVEWTDAPTWIIDPIDGTSNFVHSIPQTCVCIGLSIDKKMVVGIVHLPVTDQTFTAIKGQGAFCNGKKIQTSTQTDLKKSVIITEAGNSRDPSIVNTKLENIRKLVLETHGIRMIGSAAVDICMVACGSGEAYVEYGIHIWDIAAAGMILEEAGGTLIDPAGGPVDYQSRRVLAACTPSVAQKLSPLLTHIELERD